MNLRHKMFVMNTNPFLPALTNCWVSKKMYVKKSCLSTKTHPECNARRQWLSTLWEVVEIKCE